MYLGLGLDLYMFFCLNSLMKSVVISPAFHYSSCKIIDNDNFTLLYYIILTLMHQIVCSKGLIDAMKYQDASFRVEGVQMKEILCFLSTSVTENNSSFLFVKKIIKGLLIVRFKLRVVVYPFFQGVNKSVRLTEKAAHVIIGIRCYYKGSASLVYKNRVCLINNGKVISPLHLLVCRFYHIITQVIKAKLFIGPIYYIAGISSLSHVHRRICLYTRNGETEKLKHLPHLFRIIFSQIIIYGHYMDTFARECVEICRKCSYKSLSFSCFHLGNFSFVQSNATYKLHIEVFHFQGSPCRLFYNGIGFRQKRVQRSSFLGFSSEAV